MRPKYNLFTLFKHLNSDGSYTWYARFWDQNAGKYSVARSTGVIVEGKRERKPEALLAANAMLPTISFFLTMADREELDHDPFLHVKPAHDEPKEKGVLTLTEGGREATLS